MIFDALTGDRVGADWLRVALAPVGDFGRRAEDAASLFGPGDDVPARARCAQIVRLATELTSEGVEQLRTALRGAPDPLDIVSRASAGDPLTDVDFFELGRFTDALDATARAWDAAGGAGEERPAVLRAIEKLLEPGRKAGAFYLADTFAEPLAVARAALLAASKAATVERERFAQAVLPAFRPVPLDAEFIVLRTVMPEVPPGLRVVRETPGYRLLALELDAAANAALRVEEQAASVVAQAEERVRCDLAAALALQAKAIRVAACELGELDRTLARVAFTQRWGGCVPTLGGDHFRFTSASFTPLRAALVAAGLPYTPLSLELDGVAVLTGPNMGGKSAALATCGFLSMCVAHGVPPPATAASFPLLASLAWIGGELGSQQSRLLSAFGNEVVRVREILDRAASPALLLIDEFARTTGPREGRALLIAVLEELARCGHLAFAATHFDGVAEAARVAHFGIAGLGENALDSRAARDITAALNAVAAVMDYRIVSLQSHAHAHSDALALAGLLGLDARIIGRARELFAHGTTGSLASTTE